MALGRGKGLSLVLLLAFVAGLAWMFRSATVLEGTEVVVKKGDTLSAIARAQGVTVAQLREWNGIEGDLIEPGQRLRILAGAPAAAAPDRPRRLTRSTKGGRVQPEAAPEGELRLPAEEPCLAGPEEAPEAGLEAGYSASRGLDVGTVAKVMSDFVPEVGRCVKGDWPSGTITFDLTVACTGRVSRVEVVDMGGMDPALIACVAKTLRHADFPAHDLPDGDSFRYPLRFDL